MWRAHRPEGHFSDVKLLAWEWVVPYMHVSIINDDYIQVQKVTKKLEALFTHSQLKIAADRIRKRKAKKD